MITTLLAATLLAATPSAPPCAVAADTLGALHASVVTFDQFLADAKQRKETWTANYEAGLATDPALVARADMVSGRWRVLVVAVDSCSDSVHTIPWLAALVKPLERIDLRVVLPSAGKSVMEAHRTHDGRAATPTVLLLDEAGEVRGCIIERPQVLVDWLAAPPDSLKEQNTYQRKMAWYAADSGQAIRAEFVAMLEAAERGERQCTMAPRAGE
jgi:hypothetical protein